MGTLAGSLDWLSQNHFARRHEFISPRHSEAATDQINSVRWRCSHGAVSPCRGECDQRLDTARRLQTKSIRFAGVVATALCRRAGGERGQRLHSATRLQQLRLYAHQHVGNTGLGLLDRRFLLSAAFSLCLDDVGIGACAVAVVGARAT